MIATSRKIWVKFLTELREVSSIERCAPKTRSKIRNTKKPLAPTSGFCNSSSIQFRDFCLASRARGMRANSRRSPCHFSLWVPPRDTGERYCWTDVGQNPSMRGPQKEACIQRPKYRKTQKPTFARRLFFVRWGSAARNMPVLSPHLALARRSTSSGAAMAWRSARRSERISAQVGSAARFSISSGSLAVLNN